LGSFAALECWFEVGTTHLKQYKSELGSAPQLQLENTDICILYMAVIDSPENEWFDTQSSWVPHDPKIITATKVL
jgi:hypothetical protein